MRLAGEPMGVYYTPSIAYVCSVVRFLVIALKSAIFMRLTPNLDRVSMTIKSWTGLNLVEIISMMAASGGHFESVDIKFLTDYLHSYD